jgi:DNA invertase Pin-like site-specific DNA recombinase
MLRSGPRPKPSRGRRVPADSKCWSARRSIPPYADRGLSVGELTVLDCDRLGVLVLSVREGWLDTSGPVRPLLVAIFGWVAEQERTRLIERTKAGLERAKRDGKRLGRPPASPVLLHAARDLVAAEMPVAEAARQKGLSRSSLRRFLSAAG